MKVFSKGSKNNKSTPLLNINKALNSSVAPQKQKSSHKIKTFKQILTQNAQITALKKLNISASIQSQVDRRPYTQRNHYMTQQSRQGMVLQGSNGFCEKIPLAKFVNSVHYNRLKSQGDNRSEASSLEKIDSIVCYGKKPTTKNIINSYIYNQKNKNILSISSQNINQLNISNLSDNIDYKTKKQSPQIQQFIQPRSNKQNEYKRINYYKNSKIIQSRQCISKKWCLSCFRVVRKIGSGRFGSVHLVQQRETQAIFALKKIDLNQVKQEEMQSQIIIQLKLQLFMNYPNILKLYGFFKEENYLYLVLEYAQQKCLFSKLSQKIDEKNVCYYGLQMIKALQYCHSESILHRDLKPQNILLSFGVAKLADFGWAAYAPHYKRKTFCGTLDYVPPQIIKGNYYDEKVDIWSLGVLIYEMAVGYAPFQTHPKDPTLTEQATMNRILQCDLKIPSKISFQLKKLIESILSTEPEYRPSLQQIEKSSWVQKYKDSGVQINKNIWDYWVSISQSSNK